MRIQRPLFLLGILAVWLISAPIEAAHQAGTSKTAFENDRVRVVEVRLKPGEKVAMRDLPDHVVYIMAPGKLKFTFPQGDPIVSDSKIGETYWGEAGKHATENIGKTEINALVIELKKPGTGNEKPPATPNGGAPICPL